MTCRNCNRREVWVLNCDVGVACPSGINDGCHYHYNCGLCGHEETHEYDDSGDVRGQSAGEIFDKARYPRMEKTIGMTYDGPADNNPFVPRVGDVVARCAHEPRPLHTKFYIVPERPVVDGTAVEWFNLCRACNDQGRGALTLHTWTEEDAAQVRAAGRS